MANHRSALKRVRTNEKSRLLNRWHRGRMRTQVKAFNVALEGDDQDAAKSELLKAISLVAKTRSRGVIHKNTAERRIGRLQKAFNKRFGA